MARAADTYRSNKPSKHSGSGAFRRYDLRAQRVNDAKKIEREIDKYMPTWIAKNTGLGAESLNPGKAISNQVAETVPEVVEVITPPSVDDEKQAKLAARREKDRAARALKKLAA